MQTARRLYLYLVSGISLGALAVGIILLLTVLLERLGLGPMGDPLGGQDPARQQLTLASAVTAVSLPVWLIHWLTAERSVRPDRPGAATERSSAVRGLYFALAMGALLLAAATGLATMIETVVLRLVGGESFGSRSIGSAFALAVVAGAAWAYHVWVRARDWSRAPMSDAGAWLPRTYLYVATFAGLMILLGGITAFIELIGRIALGEASAFTEPGYGPWWAYPLASALSGALIGGGIWLGHAAFSGRLVRDRGWRGASERPAKLRVVFFVAVLIASAGAAIYLVGEGIGNALAAALGVADTEGSAQTLGLVILPVLSAVAYGFAWWTHSRWMEGEAVAMGSSERLDTERRLQLYPMALVGLAFGATATAWLISILIDVVLGGDRQLSGGAGWRRELAQFVPFAVLGIGVWVWRWSAVRSRRALDPVGEAASTTRRATLLVVLAVGIGAVVISTGFILYRLFGSIFGLTQAGDPISELSLPLGVLVVAGAVAAFHGSQLRRDQALRDRAVTSSAEPAAVARTVSLRLTTPAGADPQASVAALQQHLPPGFSLEVVGESGLPQQES